jgi:hypothetical protein
MEEGGRVGLEKGKSGEVESNMNEKGDEMRESR